MEFMDLHNLDSKNLSSIVGHYLCAEHFLICQVFSKLCNLFILFPLLGIIPSHVWQKFYLSCKIRLKYHTLCEGTAGFSREITPLSRAALHLIGYMHVHCSCQTGRNCERKQVLFIFLCLASRIQRWKIQLVA